MSEHTEGAGGDGSTDERAGFARRPLLQALGIGAAVSLGSGVAAADHEEPHPPHIDSRYGYATPNAQDVPSELEPDHVVELHIVPGSRRNKHGPLFHFAPTGLSIDPGDIVQFTFTTPDHTITAYHPAHGFQRRIPEGAPPFSSPVVSAGGAWLYRFEEEGLYDVYCAPHHILGMTMRIVVGDLAPEDVPEYESTFRGSQGPPPLLPPFDQEMLEDELDKFSLIFQNHNPHWVWLTPREVLKADALDPANIQASGDVTFDEVLDDIDRIRSEHGHG